jgi:polysaccharide biosynthesis protein PslG
MKLRVVLFLICILLSLAISADRTSISCPGAWSANSNSQIVEQGLGVNIHFTDPQPGEMKMIADAGFRWVRMDLKWDATERERGQYDFGAYDRLMTSLDQYRIRALFILDYGNPIYGGNPPKTDEAKQAFARWAVAAAEHFANRGVTWELYNEPNINQFWPPKPNVGEYIALASLVGRAFRQQVPNEKLIGPATSGIDFDFLEACFKAGLLDYWSAVSVHPYRQEDPETAVNDYCRLRALIDNYRTARGSERAREIPIISGEWGFSAVWRQMDEAKQGALFAREMLMNVANGIPLSIWYDWRDDGADPRESEHHFGLVKNSYLREQNHVYPFKPAYLAAKTLTEFLGDYRFEKRLAVGSREDYVLVFTNGNDRRFAAWTTSSTPHRIVVPVDSGSIVSVRHTGESTASIAASQRAVTIEVSTAPVYLRSASAGSYRVP